MMVRIDSSTTTPPATTTPAPAANDVRMLDILDPRLEDFLVSALACDHPQSTEHAIREYMREGRAALAS